MMTYTSIPAIVQSYNSIKQTVNVKVATETPTYFGDNIPAADLEDVPVMFPQGSDWVIAGTLEAGDAVLLVVPHYGIEEYLQGPKRKEGKPQSVRRHDLNEAVALPGMFTFNEPTRKLALKDTFHIAQGDENHITFDDTNGITITSGTNIIQMNASGITITGNVNIIGNLSATTMTSGGIPFGTHVHTHQDDNGVTTPIPVKNTGPAITPP
jgi:hypothetical protein